jgi:hypothetical protein
MGTVHFVDDEKNRLNPKPASDPGMAFRLRAHAAEFPIWVPGDFLKGDRPELLLAS